MFETYLKFESAFCPFFQRNLSFLFRVSSPDFFSCSFCHQGLETGAQGPETNHFPGEREPKKLFIIEVKAKILL